MTYLYAWLLLGLIGFPLLYIGYGFVRSAIAGRDHLTNKTPSVVLKIDTAISLFFILLDGLLNITHMPFICLDFWPQRAFRLGKIKGMTVIVPELITARCGIYGVDPTQYKFRRYIASVFAAFTGSKEPRGWHVEGSHERIDWLGYKGTEFTGRNK